VLARWLCQGYILNHWLAAPAPARLRLPGGMSAFFPWPDEGTVLAPNVHQPTAWHLAYRRQRVRALSQPAGVFGSS